MREKLADFEAEDGTPITMKAILYDRYLHWCGSYEEVFSPADVTAKIGVVMTLGVNSIKTTTTKIYYNLEGKHLSQPQKGINVVRYSDGTTKKIYMK